MDKNQHITVHISPVSVLKGALVIVLLLALFVIKDLILAILVAVAIAAGIEPAVRWLVQRKIPRVMASVMIYIGLAGLMALSSYLLMVPLFNEVVTFLRELPEYLMTLDLWSPEDQSFAEGLFPGLTEGFSLQEIVSHIQAGLEVFADSFVGALVAIFGGLFSFLLIIVISFYLSVQEDGVGKFLMLISPLKHREYIFSLWNRAEKKIGLWMQGQLILALVVGVIVYVGLSLLGVEHALLLAVLAGLFELIPLFGPILAAIPAIAIAFIDGGVTLGLLVTGLYVIIQQFESQLIHPLVVNKIVGVPPIVSIIALVIGGKLAGFIGILLAVPVAAVLMEFLYDLQREHVKLQEK